MSFDCSQCLDKCRADCCRGPIPIERAVFHRNTPVRTVTSATELGNGFVMIVSIEENTEGKLEASCPFLGYDNKCTIYKDRPFPCRDFGTENSIHTVCSYQDKNGKIRRRQERRSIEREQGKEIYSAIKN